MVRREYFVENKKEKTLGKLIHWEATLPVAGWKELLRSLSTQDILWFYNTRISAT